MFQYYGFQDPPAQREKAAPLGSVMVAVAQSKIDAVYGGFTCRFPLFLSPLLQVYQDQLTPTHDPISLSRHAVPWRQWCHPAVPFCRCVHGRLGDYSVPGYSKDFCPWVILHHGGHRYATWVPSPSLWPELPPSSEEQRPPPLTLLSIIIMSWWALPQNLWRGEISWSSCGPQLNRLYSNGSDFPHTRLVPIPYVWGVPWTSISPISQIAQSKSLVDGGQMPSWIICRDKWIRSQKESPRRWWRCPGSCTRCQLQVRLDPPPLHYTVNPTELHIVPSWSHPMQPHICLDPFTLHVTSLLSSILHINFPLTHPHFPTRRGFCVISLPISFLIFSLGTCSFVTWDKFLEGNGIKVTFLSHPCLSQII